MAADSDFVFDMLSCWLLAKSIWLTLITGIFVYCYYY